MNQTGWWFFATPRRNRLVTWDDDSNLIYGEIKKRSKPPSFFPKFSDVGPLGCRSGALL